MESAVRSRKIVKTGIIGIAVNAGLAAAKMVIGAITASVSVTTDGLNNLADALSSLITVISARLAARPADKAHPYGYGRTEYLSTLVIGCLIVYSGFSALMDAVPKLFTPEKPDYTSLTLWILAAGIVVKLLLGFYFQKEGKFLSSESLTASGKDSLSDVILSGSVLAAAIFYQFTGITIEAWLALLLSILIIKSGLDTLKETLTVILGSREDHETYQKVIDTLTSVEPVRGAYDLFFHDYGPSRKIASVHVEVPDTMTADEIDVLSRKLGEKVYEEDGIVLSAVGVYSYNTQDREVHRVRQKVREILSRYPDVQQMHGFYYNPETKELRFDIIIGFEASDRRQEYLQICQAVQEAYPDAVLRIGLDSDISS